MLQTTPYFTTAPITGLLPQLFDSSVKSAIENGARSGAALDYWLSSETNVAPSTVSESEVISFLQAFAENPPVFTVYQLSGRSGSSAFVSPFAPLFNIVV